jgi:hypothetical protein
MANPPPSAVVPAAKVEPADKAASAKQAVDAIVNNTGGPHETEHNSSSLNIPGRRRHSKDEHQHPALLSDKALAGRAADGSPAVPKPIGRPRIHPDRKAYKAQHERDRRAKLKAQRETS